jgi:hypothetical protein
VVVGGADVVVGASVVVVVVGASEVVDGGVPVSDALDDGGLVDGACVSVAFDGAGFWLDVAGAVLTLGAGVIGALPEV